MPRALVPTVVRPPLRRTGWFLASGAFVALAALLPAAARLATATSPGSAGPFRLTLPALAADSAESAGTVTAGNMAVSVNGGLLVYGEVHNGLATAITGVSVTVSALGPGAVVRDTRTVAALTGEIAAGGTGLFDVLFPSITDAATAVSASVTTYQAEAAPLVAGALGAALGQAHPLQVVTVDPDTKLVVTHDSPDVSVVDGTVTNRSSRSFTAVDVFVAFYDGAGRLAFVVHASPLVVPGQPTDAPAVLGPGQVGAFTVQYRNADYLALSGQARAVAFLDAEPTS